jgi:hypothetical protein
MSSTYAVSESTTCTEARVRAVLAKVLDDFIALVTRRFLTADRAAEWCRDLLEVLIFEAVEYFELQFTLPSGSKCGVRYSISDDGTLMENRNSGGIDYYSLPEGTATTLLIHLRTGVSGRESAVAYLRERGWTFNGAALTGALTRDRAYSREGYGVVRARVGAW